MPTDDWTGSEVAGRRPGVRYAILGRLADGGMASAYRGRGSDGADVVVKTPLPSLLANPQFRGRFDREVRTLMAVAHPHVVRLLDAGEANGVPFLVVPYYGGGTLATRQERTPAGAAPMPAAAVPGWLSPVAAAVDYLHQRNLLHRDLKPDNIFFDAAGQPLVADFGIVKVVSDDPEGEATVYTQPGATLGTPAYMAPELIMGRPVDGRIDVYALGVVVYEWLTGRVPFEGTNPAAILVKQFSAAKSLVHPCDANPAIPKEVAAVVLKAMAVNPADRYRRAGEFAAAVAEAVRAATPAPAPPRPPAEAAVSASGLRNPPPPPVSPPVVPPPAPAPVAGPAERPAPPRTTLQQDLDLPRDAVGRGMTAAHLVLAWVALLGGLARLAPAAGEVALGHGAVRVGGLADFGVGPGEIGVADAAAAVVLWPLAFLVAAALVWFRRPPARVVGLLLAAAVGWGGLTDLFAGVVVTRPAALGGWLAPWWVGLPYAAAVWLLSFRAWGQFQPAAWPPAVTVLARATVLLGGGLAVAAGTAMAHQGGGLTALQWLLLVALAGVGGVLIPAGVGLLRRQEWARVAVLAAGGVLALSVVGLAYFAAAVAVLLRQSTAAEFRPGTRESTAR